MKQIGHNPLNNFLQVLNEIIEQPHIVELLYVGASIHKHYLLSLGTTTNNYAEVPRLPPKCPTPFLSFLEFALN